MQVRLHVLDDSFSRILRLSTAPIRDKVLYYYQQKDTANWLYCEFVLIDTDKNVALENVPRLEIRLQLERASQRAGEAFIPVDSHKVCIAGPHTGEMVNTIEFATGPVWAAPQKTYRAVWRVNPLVDLCSPSARIIISATAHLADQTIAVEPYILTPFVLNKIRATATLSQEARQSGLKPIFNLVTLDSWWHQPRKVDDREINLKFGKELEGAMLALSGDRITSSMGHRRGRRIRGAKELVDPLAPDPMFDLQLVGHG